MSPARQARSVQRGGNDGFSRRAALKAAAGVLLGGCAADEGGLFARRPVGKRVIVVGAGLAGLACAHELHRAGYDVNVFEARRRVGGRVVSLADLVPGAIVEAGGEWIGAGHATWLAYKDRFKLELIDGGDGALDGTMVLEGKRLDDRQAQLLKEEMGAALRPMLDQARAVDADQPWNTPNARELDMRTVGDVLSGLQLSALCRRALVAELEADGGVPVARQSYLGKLAQIKAGGLEDYWPQRWRYRCKAGSQELAIRLARSIGMLRLKMGMPVVAIHATDGLAHVSTADGTTYEADDVVLAAPPSVWRKIHIYPELSAVLRVQTGAAVKYVAMADAAAPASAAHAAIALTDGPISRAWNGSAGAGPALLVAYSAGPAADAVRRVEPQRRDSACQAELLKVFPEAGPSFRAARFVDWVADPWTGAGVSFPGPGDVTTNGPLLARGHGPIHFAGEHVCYAFAGTMEGALRSGVTVARRLALRDGALEAWQPTATQ